MNIWEYTMADLCGNAAVQPDVPCSPEVPMNWNAEQIELIETHNGFATAPLADSDDRAHQVLLQLQNEEWRCVGHYVDDTITVFGALAGQGLGNVLFLRCLRHRNNIPITTAFTARGRRLLERAHREEIQRAIARGEAVPERVIKEYPDLSG